MYTHIIKQLLMAKGYDSRLSTVRPGFVPGQDQEEVGSKSRPSAGLELMNSIKSPESENPIQVKEVGTSQK